MLRIHAVADAVEPCLQIGEDEVDHWHELFGNFGIAALGDRMMIVALLAQAGIAAPIVCHDQRTRHDGILDKAGQGLGAAVGGDDQPHSTGIAIVLPPTQVALISTCSFAQLPMRSCLVSIKTIFVSGRPHRRRTVFRCC